MTKSLDFYFDFISPYSFIAYKKLKLLNNFHEININYKPILLGGLHKLSGITAPAFNDRKMKNMKNDCKIVALKANYMVSKFSIIIQLIIIQTIGLHLQKILFMGSWKV